MSFIKGITVKLFEKTQTGVDAFNNPVFEGTPVDVDNVIVSPVEAKDVIDTLTLTGKKAVYELCIPKGDTHNWEDCRVDFFGQSFRVFGAPKEYIEENIPLEWNKKYKVEQYG